METLERLTALSQKLGLEAWPWKTISSEPLAKRESGWFRGLLRISSDPASPAGAGAPLELRFARGVVASGCDGTDGQAILAATPNDATVI